MITSFLLCSCSTDDSDNPSNLDSDSNIIVYESDENYHWIKSNDNTDIEKSSHTYREEVVAPTYSSQGYTHHICTVCGHSYDDNFVDANPIMILWKDENGNVIEIDENVPYGTIPEYNGDPLTKDDDEYNSYVFDGWSPAVEAATKTTFYTVSFKAVPFIYHTVTFDSKGGTTISPQYIRNKGYIEEPDNPTKDGYQFNYWKYNNAEWSFTDDNVTGDITLEAEYSTINYTITYDVTGGINNSLNPSTYTIEDNITLEDPTCNTEGYHFAGWYNTNNEQVTSIEKGSFGPLSLVGHWTANKNNFSLVNENEDLGSVQLISGDGYTNEEMTVLATPDEGSVFDGWYDGSEKVSENEEYVFSMPSSDYELSARFITQEEYEEKIDEWNKNHGITPKYISSSYFTYGLYPQKHVSDEDLLEELESKAVCQANGWYLYNDDFYVKAECYHSGAKFDDLTDIKFFETYWYKCEPILWRTLGTWNGDKEYYGSAITYYSIDAHRFHSSTSSRNINGTTKYANNYLYSELRSWMQDTFTPNAFYLGADYLTGFYSSYGDDLAIIPPDYVNLLYTISRSTEWARANGQRTTMRNQYFVSNYVWSSSEGSSSFLVTHAFYDETKDKVVKDSQGIVNMEFFGIRPCINIRIPVE